MDLQAAAHRLGRIFNWQFDLRALYSSRPTVYSAKKKNLPFPSKNISSGSWWISRDAAGPCEVCRIVELAWLQHPKTTRYMNVWTGFPIDIFAPTLKLAPRR